MTIISEFLSKVQAVYKTGAATEHSYRSALENLFGSLAEGVTAVNAGGILQRVAGVKVQH
jgi:hypothetical protein